VSLSDEEETLLLTAKYYSEISTYTHLLISDLKRIEFVRDKRNLMQFAEANGIPIPKTHYLSPPNPSPLGEREGEGYVIKPRISSGSFGLLM